MRFQIVVLCTVTFCAKRVECLVILTSKQGMGNKKNLVRQKCTILSCAKYKTNLDKFLLLSL